MRYFCIVSYDGSNYSGYQKQKHDDMTIQEKIENACSYIFKEQITIYASGRTDKHVHALNQTFHFDAPFKIPTKNVTKALNDILPLDIRIKSTKIVSDDFHARFSKVAKEYIYKIINSKKISPFKSRYYSYIKEDIDVEKLKEVSKLFIGTFNFKNFTTNTVEEVESFVKTISNIEVNKKNNEIDILFVGSGFLKYQIRMMVGAMLCYATNKKDLNYIKDMLDENSNNRCSFKADPEGLYLKKVIYK